MQHCAPGHNAYHTHDRALRKVESRRNDNDCLRIGQKEEPCVSSNDIHKVFESEEILSRKSVENHQNYKRGNEEYTLPGDILYRISEDEFFTFHRGGGAHSIYLQMQINPPSWRSAEFPPALLHFCRYLQLAVLHALQECGHSFQGSRAVHSKSS